MNQKGFPIRWHFERIPIINLAHRVQHSHERACGLKIKCSQLSCSRGTRQLRTANKARVMQFSPRPTICICGRAYTQCAIWCNVPFIFLPRANESHSVPLAAACNKTCLFVCFCSVAKFPHTDCVFRSTTAWINSKVQELHRDRPLSPPNAVKNFSYNFHWDSFLENTINHDECNKINLHQLHFTTNQFQEGDRPHRPFPIRDQISESI